MVRYFAIAALLVVFASLVMAQPPAGWPASGQEQQGTREELLRQKAPEIVRERGDRNESQDLLVVVDDSEISRQAEERRKQKGLSGFDDEINEEYRRSLKQLKDQIFSERALGKIELLRDYPEFALILVRVPSGEALLALTGHPGVISVTEIDRKNRSA